MGRYWVGRYYPRCMELYYPRFLTEYYPDIALIYLLIRNNNGRQWRRHGGGGGQTETDKYQAELPVFIKLRYATSLMHKFC